MPCMLGRNVQYPIHSHSMELPRVERGCYRPVLVVLKRGYPGGLLVAVGRSRYRISPYTLVNHSTCFAELTVVKTRVVIL